MTGVPLIGYLALSILMFCIGAVGVVIRRNPIVIFMCIELMLNAANLAFLSFARYQPWKPAVGQIPTVNAYDVRGQVMVVFVMAVTPLVDCPATVTLNVPVGVGGGCEGPSL